MPENRWNSSDAPSEAAPLDLVVYRSRLIGADPNLVVWGGGNTSVKTVETDHLARDRRVLRVKGSGTDLKSVDRSGFPGVYIDDVLPLLERDSMSDEDMVAYVERCLVEPQGARPSIETLLHAFVLAKHVDHTHADAIITLTNADDGEQAVREALGEGVAYVPWIRPGFQLSKLVGRFRDVEAVVLGNHGLITWGETAEESYRTHIDLVRRAEEWLDSHGVSTPPSSEAEAVDLDVLLPRLRGRLGHRILRLWTAPEYRAISDRPDVDTIAAAGPATADHVLRIRPWACVIRGSDPAGAIDRWERRYRDWFAEHAWDGLDMLEPLPKVVLVPGIGMITAGKNLKEAQVAGEVAYHTLRIAACGTDVHGEYRSLNSRDLFDVEYWPLELYKLTLAPARRELEGRVVAVTGAASGIGRAVARHLAGLGAQVALIDLDASGLARTQAMIRDDGHGEPLPVTVDLTDETEVVRAVSCVVQTYGGLDALVSNAGIAAAGPLTEIDADFWRRSLEVNATSHFLMTQSAMRVMREQGLGGSLVYVASKNAFGPGAGFGAYSAAKAAQVQLARIAALEGGTDGIRSNVINPDAIFDDSRLWTEDVRRERAAAHGVAVEELPAFYANRNLLKTQIRAGDVAEAVAFLVSDRSRATTGTVITVDGGVAAAFPR